jgi:hypothetical protein
VLGQLGTLIRDSAWFMRKIPGTYMLMVFRAAPKDGLLVGLAKDLRRGSDMQNLSEA